MKTADPIVQTCKRLRNRIAKLHDQRQKLIDILEQLEAKFSIDSRNQYESHND